MKNGAYAKKHQLKYVVLCLYDTWMYIPVAGNFPNNKVKLNHAENIEIAPRWTPAIEASTVNGMMIYNVHAIIVNISNTLDTALTRNQYKNHN